MQDGDRERRAEVEAAIEMARSGLKKNSKIIADRNYDQTSFIDGMREVGMIAHPRAKSKYTQLSPQTRSNASYKESMRHRYKVEEVFGWGKTVGRMRQTKLRGVDKVGMDFMLQMVAENLLTTVKRAPSLAQLRPDVPQVAFEAISASKAGKKRAQTPGSQPESATKAK